MRIPSAPSIHGKLKIRKDDWIEGRTLSECKLDDEGVRVLGIYRRSGSYLGVPKDSARPNEGDTVVLYGEADRLIELDRRRADRSGEDAHEDAIRHHRRKENEEARRDEESTRRKSQGRKEEAPPR